MRVLQGIAISVCLAVSILLTGCGDNKSSHTTITEYTVPTNRSGPGSIITGPDGNIWFAEWWGHNIGKITTAGVITEYAVPTTGTINNITSSPDGKLWFTVLIVSHKFCWTPSEV